MNAVTLSILISYGLLSSGGLSEPGPQVEKSGFAAMLTRHEWHRLGEAAWEISLLMQSAQPVATQVWPHAARDAAGRAGLIIRAERPLLMTLNLEDIRLRAGWTMAAVLATGRLAELEGLPVDYLALTDAEGTQLQKWYLEVEVQTARRVFVGLRDGTMSMDSAYATITSSWKLVTPPVPVTASQQSPAAAE